MLNKYFIKVLDMIEFDRKQELQRLKKKTEDFLRRVEHGLPMVGDQDELRYLEQGAEDRIL